MGEKLSKPDTLADLVYERLCGMILEMTAGNNRLPSEEELASTLGVSRTTMREALKRLATEGCITTVHGKGTFGHPSVLKLRGRIDSSTDFYRLLQQKHEKVEMRIKHYGVRPSSELFAQYLRKDRQDVYCMQWRYYASDLPMLFGAYEFPLSSFQRMPEDGEQYTSLTSFSKQCLKSPIVGCAMYLSSTLNPAVARKMELPESTPLLRIAEPIFDIEDFQVGFAAYYMHPLNMKMTMVAKFDIA